MSASELEPVFATVRHRAVRAKGALSPTAARLTVSRLVMAAAETSRRSKGENLAPKVVAGATFEDGTDVIVVPADRATLTRFRSCRVGQKGTSVYVWDREGTRPRAVQDTRCISACLDGAVCPERGVGAGLVMPKANAEGLTNCPGDHDRERVSPETLGRWAVEPQRST